MLTPKPAPPFLTLLFAAMLSLSSSALMAAEPSAIERELVITVQGEERLVGLDQALALLNVASVSIALIDEGRIAFARANSAPVTVIAVPGSAYHYSGGGYEIAEALMQDVTGKPFPQLMQDLVLNPMGMTDSSFDQPASPTLMARAVSGRFSDGKELPGRWHIFPEHAAAGLWSTPTDLGKLLVHLADTCRA